MGWAAGRLGCVPPPPPPRAARYGVLRVCLGHSEGWKATKPKLGGLLCAQCCHGGNCPQNRDSGRLAQDILRFWTTAWPKGTVGPQKGPHKAQNGVMVAASPGCQRGPCVPKGALDVPHGQPSGLEAQRSDPGVAWQRRGPFWAAFGHFWTPPPSCVAHRWGLRRGFAVGSGF